MNASPFMVRIRVGREEKSPGDLLLAVAHDVQDGAAALGRHSNTLLSLRTAAMISGA